MSAKIFLDTNTLIYILEGREPGEGITLTPAELEANRKGEITLSLLESDGLFVGVQVFNELCNVVLRRKFDWLKAKELLATLEALCVDVVPLTLSVHKLGLALREKYRMQLFDAMLVAAALEAGCATFYSEDMQDGQVIEEKLTIKNPFKI
jgi:predicted nucleic acid-binding protein